MVLQRLEIYLDSYNSKPFVYERHVQDNAMVVAAGTENDHAGALAGAAPLWLSASDEMVLEDWICQVAGRQVHINTDLRVEDIRLHQQPESNGQQLATTVESTCVRVRLVDQV
jgi:hypothetical protein